MNNGLDKSQKETDQLCINTIRTLSMDAIQKANSGHPGAPMGLAAAGYVLWTRVLKHNPENPAWLDRDRFILSGGHASMLLYSLLFLAFFKFFKKGFSKKLFLSILHNSSNIGLLL